MTKKEIIRHLEDLDNQIQLVLKELRETPGPYDSPYSKHSKKVKLKKDPLIWV